VAGPPGLTALLQHLERAGSLGTGDMEVRVLEQQGNGGEVRIEGSQFLVESRPLAHRVPTYGFRVALPDRAGTLDVAGTDAAGVHAARIAAEAEAAGLVLTHFSPSVDGAALADEARAIHPRIIAAQDLAEIPL